MVGGRGIVRGMAAAMMVTSVVGVVVGFVLLAWAIIATLWALAYEKKARREQHRADNLEGVVKVLDGQLSATRETMAGEREERTRITERMLEYAMPPRDDAAPADGDGQVRSDAEYEPPEQPVGDWTDPFFGIDRPLVAGLAPGQGIPGIGQQDDGGDDAGLSDVMQRGEDLFDEWEGARDG